MDEFVVSWTKKSKYAEVTVPSGTAEKSKLLKYAKERPDEVTNVVVNKDGSLFCHIPVSWTKKRSFIGPPRKISEEQRAAMGERSRKRWADIQNDPCDITEDELFGNEEENVFE